ncbi:protein of unknown function [Azospirillum baldaniorum]|uniref:Uncharacterized protein n=1 Tax=Azospirillum baldaniorum TaxID=1064539 RepID=A0A9P1NN30_9PROT|nr:protein of unknown function [Azospirillum baldaniorum]
MKRPAPRSILSKTVLLRRIRHIHAGRRLVPEGACRRTAFSAFHRTGFLGPALSVPA